MSLQIRQLSYNLGAEISGVDIQKPLDEKTICEIRSAFLKCGVLLFRGRRLTREQHVAFSKQFGETEDQREPLKHDLPHRELLIQETIDPTALVWHADRTFALSPWSALLLRGVNMPAVGGDTLFSNMYLAYETLSDGMKKIIDGLYGIHPGRRSRLDFSTPDRLEETKRCNPPVAQPLVRAHPETGRKALYLGVKVTQIAGMTTEESKPLIDFLLKHATRPQFVYRHVWQTDDLLMLDNTGTIHLAVGDYDKTQIRQVEKTHLAGTLSGGYIYNGPVDVSHY